MYVDLASLPEDERIDVIGKAARRDPTKSLGIIVQDDETALRYAAKLRERFPGIRILPHVPFSGGTVLFKLMGPVQ